jgi:hypothetical protein
MRFTGRGEGAGPYFRLSIGKGKSVGRLKCGPLVTEPLEWFASLLERSRCLLVDCKEPTND